MKQPKFENIIPRWKKAETFRDAALVIAIISSLLLLLNWNNLGVVAFIGIISLFLGAIVAIIALFLALNQKNIITIVQNLLLMLWLILLPLIFLSQKLNQLEDHSTEPNQATQQQEK